MSAEKSYAQILKASSIMGVAAAAVILLGAIRVKFAAMLIGSIGVGLHSSYSAIQSLIGTFFSLGLQFSAVKTIAAAVSKGDNQEISLKILVVRRICWLTGLVGMLIMMMLSPIISQFTFGNQNYAVDVAVLSLSILFANLSIAEMSLIQGMRRIDYIARINVLAGILATIMAIGLYQLFEYKGVVLAIVMASAAQLVICRFYTRKICISKVRLSFKQTFVEANDLVQLGLVTMFSSLLVSAVTYITVALITMEEGTQAVGLYSAAFALSGLFVNFVLGAMGSDYYPRLIALANNKVGLNSLVNQQTEIGLLLTLPGLIFTIVFAPWILQIFYAPEFLDALQSLRWFVLGCLGRVISWPLGFVMLALGKGRWFLFTEICANVIHLALIAIGLKLLGIEGIAIAFYVLYLGYIVGVYLVCRYLTGFSWSQACHRLVLFALLASGVVFVFCQILTIWLATLIGTLMTLTLGIFCLRELVKLLESEHRIVQFIRQLPGAKLLFNLP